LFRDSDTGWHIRNGEAILQNFALPRVDHFSYTREGQSWIAWEWLSDAVFGLAHRIAGLSGVAVVASLAIALAVLGVARLSLSLGGNLFLTAGAAIVLLGTSSIHWLARPHVFSWVFALTFVAVAERERRSRSGALYLLPVVACLWANMHGSFLLGPGILFLYAIGDWLECGLKPTTTHSRFALSGLLSLLATFINPYGWRLHDHVFAYLQNSYLMDHIAEFRSFSFHAPGSYSVEIFLFIATVGIVVLFRQRAFGPAMLGLAMLHFSLYSARHLPTAAVLLLPLSAAALTREARESSWLRPLMDYSDRLRAMDRKVIGVIPLVILLVLTAAGVKAQANSGTVGFDPGIFPVHAAEFLEKTNRTGRIFSKDQWGGYLIYRFAGRTKVFLDGRSEFYGQQMLETYAQVADVKPSWNQVLNQYDVQLVLIPSDHALASVLRLDGHWKRIYSDSIAEIFERVG
jgi:hypothetical protein